MRLTPPNRGHQPRFWLALLTITLLLAGCASSVPTASPALIATPPPVATPAVTPTPPAPATPSLVVATPTPLSTVPSTAVPTEQVTPEPAKTPSPTSALPGTTALVLPPGTVRMIDLLRPPPGAPIFGYPPKAGGPPTGPYVYIGSDRLPSYPAHLTVVDLGGASTRTVPLPTHRYEHIGSALVDGRSLVLLVYQQQGPQPEGLGTPCSSNSGKPIDWRLLVTTLGADGLPAGAWRTLDSGTASREFRYPTTRAGCDDPAVPAVAVADGRVAYATDHDTAEFPAGSRIALRALSNGSLQRRIDAVTQVTALALSDTSVAWSESPNAAPPGGGTRWRVMRAPLATGLAAEVPIGEAARGWPIAPFSVVLDGHALVAAGGADGLSTDMTVRSEGTAVMPLNPTGTPGCQPIAAVSTVVVLVCAVEGRDEAIATWSRADGLRVLSGALPALEHSERISSGWLSWVFFKDAALTEPVLMGVPLSALAAADR